MFYLRIKLICVWFKYVVCFISITCFSCHHQPSQPWLHLHFLSILKKYIYVYVCVYIIFYYFLTFLVAHRD